MGVRGVSSVRITEGRRDSGTGGETAVPAEKALTAIRAPTKMARLCMCGYI